MPDTASLTSRIDAEFSGAQQKVAAFQQQAEQAYREREQRYQQQFVPAVARISALLRPRLEVLVAKFKDRVHVEPVVTEHMRQATFKFDSRVARIELTFRVSHDADVRNLVFDQTLEVLPILMQFEKHSGLTVPLDKVDDAVIVKWVDDRIVAFVQTFLAIQQNQYYQKDNLVTDPVSGTEMPRYAARCTLESGGKTYYFISDETKREFEQQQTKG
jgi:YHS domain-containing protein